MKWYSWPRPKIGYYYIPRSVDLCVERRTPSAPDLIIHAFSFVYYRWQLLAIQLNINIDSPDFFFINRFLSLIFQFCELAISYLICTWSERRPLIVTLTVETGRRAGGWMGMGGLRAQTSNWQTSLPRKNFFVLQTFVFTNFCPYELLF